MKIRNINNIKNVALAIAAFALAAPAVQAQGRLGIPTSAAGQARVRGTSQMANTLVNNANGYPGPLYGYGYYGYLNNYSPYLTGADPYSGIYDVGSPYAYRAPGAVVMGPNGQIADTTPYPYDAQGVEDQGVVVPTNQSGTMNVPTTQLNDQIAALRLSGNRVKLAWVGDPRPVSSMTFSLLDSKRNEIRHADVSGLPAQAIFTRPSNAVYYRVSITYGDGAVRSLIGSL